MPEKWLSAYLDPLAWDIAKVLLAKYALQFVVVLRARKEDLPKVARAIWKRPGRKP